MKTATRRVQWSGRKLAVLSTRVNLVRFFFDEEEEEDGCADERVAG